MKLAVATQFFYNETPMEVVHKNLMELKPIEAEYKTIIRSLINSSLFEREVSGEIKEKLELYLSKEWIYFNRAAYNNEALELMNECRNLFSSILSKAIFRVKKELLSFQAGLISKTEDTANA